MKILDIDKLGELY